MSIAFGQSKKELINSLMQKNDSLLQIIDIERNKHLAELQRRDEIIIEVKKENDSIMYNLKKSIAKVQEAQSQNENLQQKLYEGSQENNNLKSQFVLLTDSAGRIKLKLDECLSELNNANNSHAESDYKVSAFNDYGWFQCAIVNNSNITLLLYANKNEYHKSGKPIYILQGTVGAPDKRNLQLGEGDPEAGVVNFKTIYVDPTKKDFIPCEGCIWYKTNKGGKDQLEQEAGEATLDVIIAN